MYQYLRREWQRGRETVILTCLEGKIKMYEKWALRILASPAPYGEENSGMR